MEPVRLQEVIGTTPRTGEVEPRREHDHTDVRGRATPGAATERSRVESGTETGSDARLHGCTTARMQEIERLRRQSRGGRRNKETESRMPKPRIWVGVGRLIDI